jgi:hypothetical protein
MGLYYEQLKVLVKKSISNPERIIPHLRTKIKAKKLKNEIEGIRKASIVWHVCTPKSASTYLMQFLHHSILEKNSKVNIGLSLPSYGNRPQVFCGHTLGARLNSKRLNMTTHTHALATDDLLEMLSENHVILCQTRSILDTVVSLVDYLNKQGPLNPWSSMAFHYWHKLSDEQKADNVIEHYVPWHISFLQGWLIASETLDVHWFNYSDVVKDCGKCVSPIFSKFNIPFSGEVSLPSGKTNFNVGIMGRGKLLLSLSQQDRIVEKIKNSDHLKQDLLRFL